ncbi:MAG: hypothetical protein Q8P50_17950 [Bacillota bacterium]|nr:hypothetical protein [Bacillota bacterium]
MSYDRAEVRAFCRDLMASSSAAVWEAQTALDHARARNRALLAARAHVQSRLSRLSSRAQAVERLEASVDDTCLRILEKAGVEADHLLGLVRPEIDSCASEALRIEAEASRARAGRARLLEGLKSLLGQPREGRRAPAGTLSRVVKAVVPVTPVALEDEIDALEMAYVVGNIAGRDLAGDAGTIIRAGGLITVEAYRRAVAEGKIAELIVYMRFPGDGLEAG